MLHEDGKPLDYVEKDIQWVMAACGHRVGGPELGTKIAMCPNCNFLIGFRNIPIIYEDRVPEGNMLVEEAQ